MTFLPHISKFCTEPDPNQSASHHDYEDYPAHWEQTSAAFYRPKDKKGFSSSEISESDNVGIFLKSTITTCTLTILTTCIYI